MRVYLRLRYAGGAIMRVTSVLRQRAQCGDDVDVTFVRRSRRENELRERGALERCADERGQILAAAQSSARGCCCYEC